MEWHSVKQATSNNICINHSLESHWGKTLNEPHFGHTKNYALSRTADKQRASFEQWQQEEHQ